MLLLKHVLPQRAIHLSAVRSLDKQQQILLELWWLLTVWNHNQRRSWVGLEQDEETRTLVGLPQWCCSNAIKVVSQRFVSQMNILTVLLLLNIVNNCRSIILIIIFDFPFLFQITAIHCTFYVWHKNLSTTFNYVMQTSVSKHRIHFLDSVVFLHFQSFM